MPKAPAASIRFGPYTADLEAGELRKHGVRIPLQIQPFQILQVFLDRPNELVTREELQQKIWPAGTFVDFEQGLNKAVNKLRVALCDTAEDPQFIETIPKRGYRFIAPVEFEHPAAPVEVSPPFVAEEVAEPKSKNWHYAVAAVLVVLVALGVAVGIYSLKRSQPEIGDVHSIAVLPLVAQGEGTDYDLADGITDSIINSLSLIPNLRVISHASVFQYRGQASDPQSVGRKLGVAAVMTGRIEQSGSVLRVVLELTATGDRRRLWGQQYTKEIADRAVLTQEAASAIAEALRLGMSPAGRQQIGRPATANAEANQLYLKGRYYFFKENPNDVLQARAMFQQAIDQDPMFALAYAALGDTYDWMATEGYQPASEVMPQAIAAKRKANELNDSLAEVHASLASLEMVQLNWNIAELEFQKAIAINPNYFEAHRLYSIYLRTMRRFPEAIAHARKCVELNPLLLPVKSHLALTYRYAGQYDAAAEQYRLILKDSPEAASAHAGLSAVLIKQGKEKEAVEEWKKTLELLGEVASAKEFGTTYGKRGLKAAQETVLKAELQTLQRLDERDYVSPVEFGYRYALLGDKENAFRWLEKAYQDRSPQLFNLNVDPDYDNLRSDPRFVDLAARLHLPN
jgi:TolB-like protein/DNA-binding winged helix-turn-helix (wHTH) protein/Flp pilus assembly protein TadD